MTSPRRIAEFNPNGVPLGSGAAAVAVFDRLTLAARADPATPWSECGRTGDNYYRLMQKWIESKQQPKACEECYAAALEYKACLDHLIASPKDTSERNLRTAIEYRSLLDRTIEMMAPQAIWPPSPIRPAALPAAVGIP